MNKKIFRASLASLLVITSGSAASIEIADAPLSISFYVKPNILLLVDSSGSMRASVPGSGKSRMTIAREVAVDFINSLDTSMRAGLATFYHNNPPKKHYTGRYQEGGMLLDQMATADDSHKAEIVESVIRMANHGNQWTPLAESLSDIGSYFSYGYNGNLTLYPGESNQNDVSRDKLFRVAGRTDSNFNQTGKSLEEPVTLSCQKSFALLITDGLPSQDHEISSKLKKYSNDSDNYYLNDVAHALYEMDLRPDLIDNEGNINNVATYTIGFASSGLEDSPLLKSTAERGGGEYYYASNSDTLLSSLKKAVESIVAGIGSASAVAANSSRLDTSSAIYQSSYDTNDWSGDLVKVGFNTNGTLGDQAWSAADKLPIASARNIYTYTGGSGVEFKYHNLNAAQKTRMGSSSVVDYIRGDTSNEERSGGSFRSRSSLIGDIINSDPIYVATEDYGYRKMNTGGGNDYAQYLVDKTERKSMVYVASNGGMLHGFDAVSGIEDFAYVPQSVVESGKLKSFSDKNYTHSYIMDGSIAAGDVHIKWNTSDSEASWGTMLVGTPGAGAKSVFAINASDPGNFDSDDVLFEFSHSELGYVIGRPVIARGESGEYYAFFGNGYNSNGQKAQLFAVNLETGNLDSLIDTHVGSSFINNGLGTPALVDTDGNGRVDMAYAGDLLGNVWKFDLSGSSPSDWSVAFGDPASPSPLFTAVNHDNAVQAITGGFEVGEPPEGKDGHMVYFGTGSFFANSDKTDMTVQSMYGVWDNGTSLLNADRSGLLEQEIIYETSVDSNGDNRKARVISDYSFDPDTHRGWYIDLLSPGLQASGERVVSTPKLRHGRIIFSTIVPSTSSCNAGGESWLMEFDAVSGGRLDFTVLDLNGDIEFDEEDYITVSIGGIDTLVPVSGVSYGKGLIKSPTVISAGDVEFKVASDSGAVLDVLVEKGTTTEPRMSWRELADW